jgi:glutaredoxin
MKNETHRVVLYARTGCHLCDVAKSLLLSNGIQPTVIDIDSDPELVERFTTCVPVVEIDGRIRFRGQINSTLLRRIIGTRVN